MTVFTYLAETVGLLDDVNMEEVEFWMDHPDGEKEEIVLALDDPMPSKEFEWFYIKVPRGFYCGNLKEGEYSYLDRVEGYYT